MQQSPIARALMDSPLGRLRLAASNRGLVELALRPTGRLEAGSDPVTDLDPRARYLLERAQGELAQYFDGKLTRFTVPIDDTTGTDFQQKVWAELRAIPFGETKSYGEIAKSVGPPEAPRAVGQACGANPIAIMTPCHRVVASDGTLGGFGPGPDTKKWLLGHEGIHKW